MQRPQRGTGRGLYSRNNSSLCDLAEKREQSQTALLIFLRAAVNPSTSWPVFSVEGTKHSLPVLGKSLLA
jgi:hypothetical protein